MHEAVQEKNPDFAQQNIRAKHKSMFHHALLGRELKYLKYFWGI